MSGGRVVADVEDSQLPPVEEYSGGLLPQELFWRDHQKWLEECGYMLRPRYRPDWTPSWQGSDALYWTVEDGVLIHLRQVLDATLISDGTVVFLKRVSTRLHPFEVEISRMFSSEPLASDRRNHSVPIYEVLQVPDEVDTVLLVMPLLRSYNDPQFQTVGEAVDFFRQLFEGMQFMHEHHVAHRDAMNYNVMMDPKPLFPNLFHPQRPDRSYDFKSRAKHYTRTRHPTKYYYIDFGLSRSYNPDDGPPREDPIWGGDKTVPEFHKSNDPCNPFPTDIYYIGNLIREDFLQTFRGLEFMQHLVDEMVQDDPGKRPDIDQVVSKFADVRESLPWWKLRSRLAKRDEFWIMGIFRAIRHVFRTIGYILTFRPAIPTIAPP